MVVGNKNKRGRKKEKEGSGFGRLPSFFFPPFLLVFLTICFMLRCGAFVQIWLCFLCFGDLTVRVLEIFFNNAVTLIYKLWNNNYVNELFQLKDDMENYVKYSLTGKPIKVKKDVFPHFFDCQKHRSNRKFQLLDLLLLNPIGKEQFWKFYHYNGKRNDYHSLNETLLDIILFKY